MLSHLKLCILPVCVSKLLSHLHEWLLDRAHHGVLLKRVDYTGLPFDGVHVLDYLQLQLCDPILQQRSQGEAGSSDHCVPMRSSGHHQNDLLQFNIFVRIKESQEHYILSRKQNHWRLGWVETSASLLDDTGKLTMKIIYLHDLLKYYLKSNIIWQKGIFSVSKY